MDEVGQNVKGGSKAGIGVGDADFRQRVWIGLVEKRNAKSGESLLSGSSETAFAPASPYEVAVAVRLRKCEAQRGLYFLWRGPVEKGAHTHDPSCVSYSGLPLRS